ncbi:MAG TPA: hypothetical protein VEL76_20465 [Gemmataceae bacterium]|nr:hypothetical protein [Gemmataceae bacterium]
MRLVASGVPALLGTLLVLFGSGQAEGGDKKGHELRGTLVYNPPPSIPDVRPPHDIETHIALMKTTLGYHEELNRRFDLAIPPASFAKLFQIARVGESKVIAVKLIWADRQQGAALVDALMEMHCKKMAAERLKILQEASKNVAQKLEAANKAYDEAVAARDKFLGKHKVIGDPKEMLAATTRRLAGVEETRDKLKAELQVVTLEIAKLKEALAALKAQPDQKAEPEDPQFKQRKREAELAVFAAREDLAAKQARLKAKEAKLPATRKNAADGIIEIRVLKALEEEIADLQREVKATEAVLKIRQQQLNELRPGNAKRNELLSQLSTRQIQQEVVRQQLLSHDEQCKRLSERATELQRLLKDAAPLLARVEQTAQARKQLLQRLTDLLVRLGDVGEVRIASRALPGGAADERKK